MSSVISNVYIEGFNREVRHLAQQSMTRLMPFVQVRGSTAEFENWERLGPTELSAKAARTANIGVPTPIADVPWSRRVSGNAIVDAGELIGLEQITQMLADPNSNVARSFAMGANRAEDDFIIAAATGTALDGQGVNNPLPAGQIVGTGYGADISFDLVTQVAEKFLDNDIDPDVQKVIVVGPAQMRKLLQTTEATNQDYAQKALMQGFVNNWMGMDWIVSTRLNSPMAGQRDCFAMTRQALGYQQNKASTTQIAQDPSNSFDWRIYTCLQGGCVRVEDEQLVKLEVSE